MATGKTTLFSSDESSRISWKTGRFSLLAVYGVPGMIRHAASKKSQRKLFILFQLEILKVPMPDFTNFIAIFRTCNPHGEFFGIQKQAAPVKFQLQ